MAGSRDWKENASIEAQRIELVHMGMGWSSTEMTYAKSATKSQGSLVDDVPAVVVLGIVPKTKTRTDEPTISVTAIGAEKMKEGAEMVIKTGRRDIDERRSRRAFLVFFG